MNFLNWEREQLDIGPSSSWHNVKIPQVPQTHTIFSYMPEINGIFYHVYVYVYIFFLWKFIYL